MKKLSAEHFVNVMNHSIQRVEKSVEQMERHTSITKTEQLQLMQAVLELADRIKLIETHVKTINK
ncbi:hypothetical protein [Psychrobacillus lasiicapitis]|uniref:Uncharacterized protein n=1 Tax=Psychrobacillus lasiicapitis TaxID=1636719 RepID=A0A544T2M6_9BACI|nr:hypothetical protein [Psychrobacillus lasiicapitis]TQR11722.1 hypothetical protein FG382_13980 [Psychrobacillus lasiicapitis]GGA18963.1 hypothetical protein GCM10011384_05250 [Psychrobacillus lasiicapitis]